MHMRRKKTVREKLRESILFLFLSAVSVLLIIGLWKFAYEMGWLNGPHRPKFLFVIFFVPVVLLCEAIMPWLKFHGFKGEIVSGQLKKLDAKGHSLGVQAEIEPEDTKRLARIFDRDADYHQEKFQCDQFAISIKTTKKEYRFFSDKTDPCLFMTDEPWEISEGGLGKGFKISEDERKIVQTIVAKYMEKL